MKKRKILAAAMAALTLALPLAACKKTEKGDGAANEGPKILEHVFEGTVYALPEPYSILDGAEVTWDAETGEVSCAASASIEGEPDEEGFADYRTEYAAFTLNADGVVRLSDVQHRFDKVLAVQAKDPRDTNNEVFGQQPAYGKLSGEFGSAIYVQGRVILVIRMPGTLSFAIEYIVRTDIDHLRIDSFGRLCDVFSTQMVDRVDFCTVLFVLGRVHSSPGRAVNDHVRIDLADCSVDRASVRNIQLIIRSGCCRCSIRYA